MPYLTPEELPEDDDCRPLSIPASTEWLAIVSGALTELTKSWNWEQQGSVTVDEAVERMQQMVADYYNVPCATCELPEGGQIIRQNGLGEFEQLVDGAWSEPEGDYELPPIPTRADPTEAERKCLAAKNATNVLKQLYEDMTDSYNLDLDPAVAFTAWVGTTSTVVLVALGLLSFSFGTILFGVWTLAYQALEFLTEDVWDEAFDEKVICALLNVAVDDAGVVTFNWRDFMDRLALRVDLGDPSIGQLRLFGQIYYMLLILGSDGLNQAGATVEITDSDCDELCFGWCYEWNFQDTDGSGDGWGTAAGFSGYGTYDPGFGWRSVSGLGLVLGIMFPDAHITEIGYFGQADSPSGGQGTDTYLREGGVQVERQLTSASIVPSYSVTFEVDDDGDEIWLNPFAGSTASVLVGGVHIRGTGPMPEWTEGNVC